MRAIFPLDALEQVAGPVHPGPAAKPGGVRGPPPEGCVTLDRATSRPQEPGRLVPGAVSLVGSGRPCLPRDRPGCQLRPAPGPVTRDPGRQRAGIGRR